LDEFFWLGTPTPSLPPGGHIFDKKMKNIIEDKEEDEDQNESKHFDSLIVTGEA